MITTHKLVSTEKLAKQIQACSQKEFTGRLNIQDPDVLHLWSLDFNQGYLTRCATSVHSIRSWCRHVSLHCPTLPLYSSGQEPDQPVYWDYNYLAQQVKQGKVLHEQMKAIVTDQVTELLFDIEQYSHRLRRSAEMELIYKLIPEYTINSASSNLVLIPAMQPMQQAMQAWVSWQKAGLANYSPNLAPVVQQPKELRKQTSPLAYHNLISLLDGKWTLRDLALKLKQELLPLTQSIMPYINQGLIALREVEDFKESFTVMATNTEPPLASRSKVQSQAIGSLVACVDDSQNDSMKMSQILTLAGYRFINIQEPMKALLILLEQKPDLIFLDLVMPIANGYEICAQIRRISAFKDTPIIILTNNDGIVDRVRAKVVGASGFLAKPIEQQKVLRIMQKYLGAPSIQSQEKDLAWSKRQYLT